MSNINKSFGNKNSYHQLSDQISDYVQHHLDEVISIDALAEHVQVSKFHLNRIFQLTTGFQLGEFIQRRRLQKAYALLAAGDCSVIDASLSVGYESHSSFSRAFLKAFGCKPNEVKLGSVCEWGTPNTLKNVCELDSELQPEIIQLAEKILHGTYGAGFQNNSFQGLSQRLLKEFFSRLDESGVDYKKQVVIGVSLDSPWQIEQEECRFFLGMDMLELKGKSFDEYQWCGGSWAKFEHVGAHHLIWQTISRIYAGWVIPQGIQLQNNAIVQVYLDDPSSTPTVELRTHLFFPLA
jgi:AraC family transcriptional regulator